MMSAKLVNVSFPGKNSEDCPGYFAGEGAKGLVVIQEWWGLNQMMVNYVDFFASQGFVAVCPDLYRGEVAVDHEHAGHLMSGLDWKGAVADIEGASDYLRSKGCSKVGVIGFCMGGALSIASAVLGKNIDASAPFYGIPSAELADPTSCKIPIQCHFGNEDALEGFSDPKSVDALEQKFKDGSVNYQIYRYDNAGHAFTNELNKDAFRKEARDLAFERAISFFNENLS
uniref:Dienelactone hydrolase domain-containing protein n=1 Tax=Vannella robusta TaxID=1487602 RepID=A0A6U1VDP3_9EUKA